MASINPKTARNLTAINHYQQALQQAYTAHYVAAKEEQNLVLFNQAFDTLLVLSYIIEKNKVLIEYLNRLQQHVHHHNNAHANKILNDLLKNLELTNIENIHQSLAALQKKTAQYDGSLTEEERETLALYMYWQVLNAAAANLSILVMVASAVAAFVIAASYAFLASGLIAMVAIPIFWILASFYEDSQLDLLSCAENTKAPSLIYRNDTFSRHFESVKYTEQTMSVEGTSMTLQTTVRVQPGKRSAAKSLLQHHFFHQPYGEDNHTLAHEIQAEFEKLSSR